MHPHLYIHHPHCPSTSTHGRPIHAPVPAHAASIPSQRRTKLKRHHCRVPELHAQPLVQCTPELHTTASASSPASPQMTGSSGEGLAHSPSSKHSTGAPRHGSPTEDASRLLTSRITACTSIDKLRLLLRNQAGLQLFPHGSQASHVPIGISNNSSSRDHGGSSSSGSTLSPTNMPGTPSDTPPHRTAPHSAFPVPLTDHHVSAVCVRCADLVTNSPPDSDMSPLRSSVWSSAASSTDSPSSSPADHPHKGGATMPEKGMRVRGAGQPAAPQGRKQVLACLREFLQAAYANGTLARAQPRLAAISLWGCARAGAQAHTLPLPLVHTLLARALGRPVRTPASAPATTPASMPTSAPASAPASAPTSTPASVPISTPTSTPTSEPVSVPASALASSLTLTSAPASNSASATHTQQASVSPQIQLGMGHTSTQQGMGSPHTQPDSVSPHHQQGSSPPVASARQHVVASAAPTALQHGASHYPQMPAHPVFTLAALSGSPPGPESALAAPQQRFGASPPSAPMHSMPATAVPSGPTPNSPSLPTISPPALGSHMREVSPPALISSNTGPMSGGQHSVNNRCKSHGSGVVAAAAINSDKGHAASVAGRPAWAPTSSDASILPTPQAVSNIAGRSTQDPFTSDARAQLTPQAVSNIAGRSAQDPLTSDGGEQLTPTPANAVSNIGHATSVAGWSVQAPTGNIVSARLTPQAVSHHMGHAAKVTGGLAHAPISSEAGTQLTPQAMSNMVWALAKINPQLVVVELPALTPLLLRCLPSMTGAQVTAVVWALASSGARPGPELSELLTEELWGRGPGAFSAREVCTLLEAFVQWSQPRPPTAQRRMAPPAPMGAAVPPAVAPRAPSPPPHHLSHTHLPAPNHYHHHRHDHHNLYGHQHHHHHHHQQQQQQQHNTLAAPTQRLLQLAHAPTPVSSSWATTAAAARGSALGSAAAAKSAARWSVDSASQGRPAPTSFGAHSSYIPTHGAVAAPPIAPPPVALGLQRSFASQLFSARMQGRAAARSAVWLLSACTRMGQILPAEVLQRILQLVKQGASGLSDTEVAACLQAMASLQAVQQDTSAKKALQKARERARKSAGRSNKNIAANMNSNSKRGHNSGTREVHIHSVAGVPIQFWAHMQATLAQRFMSLLPEPPAGALASTPASASAPPPAAAALSTASTSAPYPAAAAPSPAPARAAASSPAAAAPSPAAGAAYSTASAAGAWTQRRSVPDAPPGVTGKAFTQALSALWSMGVGPHLSTDLERVLHCAHKLAQQQRVLDRRSIVTLAKLMPGLAVRQAQLQQQQQQQSLALVQASPKAVLRSLLVSSMSMGLRLRQPLQSDQSASTLLQLHTRLTSGLQDYRKKGLQSKRLTSSLSLPSAAAANPTPPAPPAGTNRGSRPVAAPSFTPASSADLSGGSTAAAAPLLMHAPFGTAAAAAPLPSNAPLGTFAAATPHPFAHGPFGTATAAGPNLVARVPAHVQRWSPSDGWHVLDVVALLQCALQMGLGPPRAWLKAVQQKVTATIALPAGALSGHMYVLEAPPQQQQQQQQQHMRGGQAQQLQQQQQHMHGGEAHQLYQGHQQQRQQQQQQQEAYGGQAHQLHQGHQQYQQQQQQHMHGGHVRQLYQGHQQYQQQQQQPTAHESPQQHLARVCHKRALELMHPQTPVKGSISNSSSSSSSSSPSQRQQPTLTPDAAALLLVGLPDLGHSWGAEPALVLMAVATAGAASVTDVHGDARHGSSTRARFLVRLLRGISAHIKVLQPLDHPWLPLVAPLLQSVTSLEALGPVGAAHTLSAMAAIAKLSSHPTSHPSLNPSYTPNDTLSRFCSLPTLRTASSPQTWRGRAAPTYPSRKALPHKRLHLKKTLHHSSLPTRENGLVARASALASACASARASSVLYCNQPKSVESCSSSSSPDGIVSTAQDVQDGDTVPDPDVLNNSTAAPNAKACNSSSVHVGAACEGVTSSTESSTTSSRATSGNSQRAQRQRRLASKRGFALPRRLVRSAPQATRNLMARCQSLGAIAGLLRAMLLLGLPPGPLWLNSMGRSLEALLDRHPQRAREPHTDEHGGQSHPGSRPSLAEDVKEVVCVLLAMRIWAQQELHWAKASEERRQSHRTHRPGEGGTALHASRHGRLHPADGINTDIRSEDLTHEHSASGAKQQEHPVPPQAGFQAMDAGMGEGDGVWPQVRAAAALTTCRRLGLRVATVLAEAGEEAEEQDTDSRGHTIDTTTTTSTGDRKIGSGSALGIAGPGDSRTASNHDSNGSTSCGGSSGANNRGTSGSGSNINSLGDCSNPGRGLGVKNAAIQQQFQEEAHEERPNSGSTPGTRVRMKNAAIQPALARIRDRELHAALQALYCRRSQSRLGGVSRGGSGRAAQAKVEGQSRGANTGEPKR